MVKHVKVGKGMTHPQIATADAVDPLGHLPDMMTAQDMATFLSADLGLLAKWRSRKVGPPWVKLTDGKSGAVRYPREGLRAYLSARAHAGRVVSL